MTRLRLLFLRGDMNPTDGWGTFSIGFLEQARRRVGASNVVSPVLRAVQNDRINLIGIVPDLLGLRTVARRSDLIHALIEPAAPLAWMLSRISGTPYVISSHGTYSDIAAYPRYLRRLMRSAVRNASKIIPVSRYTASVVRRSFGDDLAISIVPGGYTALGAPSPRRTKNELPRLLSVGVLKARKGFHTLIAAVERLNSSGIAVSLDIVGRAASSAYLDSLKRAVALAHLEDRVTFHGRAPAEVVADLYSRADLFVMASEHDGVAFEGLGLVYLEALSYGVPVIGARESGAEDVISDGENGMLVAPSDPDGLATAIRRIVIDDALATKMRSAAPKSVKSFEWDQVGDRMEQVWRTCAKR